MAASRAFLLAMVAALAADALLGTFTRLVDVAGPADATAWWVAAHLVERCRWVVLALMLMAAARALPDSPSLITEGAGAWRAVGVAVVTVPLLWIVATWTVQATLFTAAGRWDIDGQVFLEPDYYRRLLIGYAPWLLGGIATLAVSRHVS